jgi:hypothetical protein
MTRATVNAVFAVAGLIAMSSASDAVACDVLDREIEEAPAKLASYSEGGKFQGDIDGADLKSKRVAGCSEVNSSLVKVALPTGEVWIDITKVRLVALQCDESASAVGQEKIDETHSKPRTASTSTPVSSGIGACKQP